MNLPNMLTVFRMVLVPVFAYLYFFVEPVWMALVVFLLAGATDVVDGYLARKWNQITDFGKLMDPLADKLMLLTMMVCLCVTGHLALWVAIAIGVKELLMVAGSALLLRRGVVVYSNLWGKLATLMLMAALALVFPWHRRASVFRAGTLLSYAGVALSYWAMFAYGWQALRKNAERKRA